MSFNESLWLMSGFYLMFLLLGVYFYYTTARVNGLKWKAGNKLLKLFRFTMYVVLLPLAFMTALIVYIVYSGYVDIF